MTIAVHISLGESPDDIRSAFNYRCFSLMAARHPEDHFIFIFDKPYAASLIGSSNITPVLLGPALKSRLLKHYWYQFKLPRILQRYQADYYINQDKMACLRGNTAQVLVIEDLDFMQRSPAYSGADRRYFRKYFPGFVQKASLVIVMNQYLKETLEKKLPSATNRIKQIHPSIEPWQDTRDPAIMARLNECTGGKSYFVFLATKLTRGHIVTALKAFSIFKKWQLSNMQLVILSSLPEAELIPENLSTYKYRHEVKMFFPASRDERMAMLSGAYASVYLSASDLPEDESLESISCGVPLVCSDSAFQRSRHDGAALFAAISETAIAEKLMRLYKEENQRTGLAETCRELALQARPENTVALMRDALTRS